MNTITNFIANEEGLETVEYAIITGLIVAVTIGFISSIGGWVSTQFETLDTALSDATAP